MNTRSENTTVALLMTCALALGCGSTTPARATGGVAEAQTLDAPASPEAASEEAPTETEPSGPPPDVRIDIGGELVLRVGGDTPVRLASVAQLVDENGDPVGEAHPLTSCDAPADPCFDLVPGAELHAPAWADLRRGQCACGTCATKPDGARRVVVRSCEGHVLTSPID